MEHGGNLRHYKKLSSRNKILDFSANINPLGIPDWVRPIYNNSFFSLAHYPDIEYKETSQEIAKYYGLESENLILVNGVAEALCFVHEVTPIKKAIILNPAFSEYERAIDNNGIEKIEINSLINEEELFNQIEALLNNYDSCLYINNPQNPTGKLYSNERIIELIKKYPKSNFIIDEAFIEFSGSESLVKEVLNHKNLIVLKSYTKLLALPGLRIGVVYSQIDIIKKYKSKLPSWNVNEIAARVLKHYYANNPAAFINTVRSEVLALIEYFIVNFKKFPFEILDSQTNFLLIKFNNKDAIKVHDFLLREKGIATRTCANFKGLDPSQYLRIAIRPIDEQAELLKALEEFYKVENKENKSKTPAIMIQGTTSNAGKSLLATAFCRIFQEDGYKVAPFKSQNMALNSFVTKEGLEIGRAQAVQAMACKLDANILMNPILLKPNSDVGSQVILHGKPLQHMHFKEYFVKKLEYFEEVKKSYDELSSQMDIMVIEGAGSPSEINLKSKDIVNMNMAKYAKANVYITADIDRGGMFASFLGTFDTLKEWENDLVKGLIINRFRGDKTLLDSGITYLEGCLKVPVIACIPNVDNHMIPEEDCIEFKSGSFNDKSELEDRVDIVVIDTPRISNFTDIDALRGEPDTRVRIISDPSEIGTPDIILLCGSKSVVRDLDYIRSTGIDKVIIDCYESGKSSLVGICGGYQFLSQEILDPDQVESAVKSSSGLGILELIVEMKQEKELAQVKAEFLPWNDELEGYEIHHGESKVTGPNIKEIVKNSSTGQTIGHSTIDGRAWGSYLHGIFDDNKFRRNFLDYHRKKMGKRPLNKVVYEYDVDQAISNLASIVRQSTDIKKIYEDLGL